MEQFKELHKTVEQLRTSGLSTGEIKKVSGMLCPSSSHEGTRSDDECNVIKVDPRYLGLHFSPNHTHIQGRAQIAGQDNCMYLPSPPLPSPSPPCPSVPSIILTSGSSSVGKAYVVWDPSECLVTPGSV